VDYANDANWIAWSEEALRRLLNGSEHQRNDAVALPIPSRNQLSPRSKTPSGPNSWNHEEDDVAGIVTPSIFETKETMFNNVPIYGHVSPSMALDDHMLDIQVVSTCEQKRASALK
jgi:hypothetical protein